MCQVNILFLPLVASYTVVISLGKFISLHTYVVVILFLSHVQLLVTPWTTACQASIFHYLPQFAKPNDH